MASNSYLNELRIVLLGKTGVGKSLLGNNLLQENIFDSSVFGESETYKCKHGTRKLADGRKLVIVDTPGLFDTRRGNEDTKLEISRCIGLSYPGPHVLIFVITVGRFTEEELETITELQKMFGKHVLKHVMVVITGKDSLEYANITLEKYVAKASDKLKNVLYQCGSRQVAVNNQAMGGALQEDMESVMEVVKQTIAGNRGNYYTGEMYAAAERVMQDEIQKKQEEKEKDERELQRRTDELKRKEKEQKINMDKQKKDLADAVAERAMLEKKARERQRKIDEKKHMDQQTRDDERRLADAAAERAMKEKIQKLQDETEKKARELQRKIDEKKIMDQQIWDTEKRLAEVRARDAREEVRRQVESSNAIISKIGTGIGAATAALGVAVGVATVFLCSIM